MCNISTELFCIAILMANHQFNTTYRMVLVVCSILNVCSISRYLQFLVS